MGMLDLNLLKVDGRPAAFAYNYQYEGRVFGLRMGYDANVSKRGVGRALIAHVLRDGHERQDSEYNLGIGNFEFKRRFCTHIETSFQYTHFPSFAWRSQSLRMSRWLKRRIQRDDVRQTPGKVQTG